jgi:FKBP-type peptidyl-prolyl cis-trans isomerase FkpA
MKSVIPFIFVCLVTGLVNCSKDIVPCTTVVPQATLDAVPKAQLATDIGRITNYLTGAGITAIEDPSGLRYVITTPGSGASPCLQGNVTVTYSGRTLRTDGTLNPVTFDASTGSVTFLLQSLILGWQVGFLKLQAGSSATLYIPSGLGYGTVSRTSIPANSVLVFNVQLVSFAQP